MSRTSFRLDNGLDCIFSFCLSFLFFPGIETSKAHEVKPITTDFYRNRKPNYAGKSTLAKALGETLDIGLLRAC